ncbi:MAG: hypothetical protein WB762_11320 [Candidatus Sulfotelmatobacter sp.]
MATDSFGEYLYLAGISGIQVLSINSTNGARTPVAGSPFPASAATVLPVVQTPPP